MTHGTIDAPAYNRVLNPLCPACNQLMRLARITPDDRKDDVELRTYACDCGYELLQTVRS